MINVSCHVLVFNTYYFSQSRVPEKAILNPPAACNGYTQQILCKVRSLEVFNINFKIMQALYVKYYTDSKAFLLKQFLETKNQKEVIILPRVWHMKDRAIYHNDINWTIWTAVHFLDH